MFATRSQLLERSPEATNSEMDLLERLVPYMDVLPPFSYAASQKCLAKGLLPAGLLGAVNTLQFLTCTVLSAQKAQRTYGVRASVLLAMALGESAYDANNLLSGGKLLDDYNGERSISSDIDEWFSERAQMLACTEPFREALPFVADSKTYIHRICALGFCDDSDARDLVSRIEEFFLTDLDMAGLLPLGQYEQHCFDRVRDDSGAVIGLKVSEVGRMLKVNRLGAA